MTGGLSRYGLLGDPVAHSLSPSMYRAAFVQLGIDASYEAVRSPEETWTASYGKCATWLPPVAVT
jgi:shikimate dehydrogenase